MSTSGGDGELLIPRVVAFTGHEFCGDLLFDSDGGKAAVPSVDEFVRVLAPAKELECLFLYAGKSDVLARQIQKELPHLTIICWKGFGLNAAAKAFAHGFYGALSQGTQVPIQSAFDAGIMRFQFEGFQTGNPEDFLHPFDHPHSNAERRSQPDWRSCPGCCPPVHGEAVLLPSTLQKI